MALTRHSRHARRQFARSGRRCIVFVVADRNELIGRVDHRPEVLAVRAG